MNVMLSIVIPTCRRTEKLAELLASLTPERQGLAANNYEVIVSDDDVSQSAAVRLQERFEAARFVAGPGKGPAANRNHGARYASGDWIVFTDDDCQPLDGWLKAIADVASRDSWDVVEGRIVAPPGNRTLFRRDVENLHGGVYWSANLAIRHEVFARLGGFDEDFGQAGGEDMELAHRFRRYELRTVFCQEAGVFHPSHVLPWRHVLEFTLRIRWHALFIIKTSPSMSPDQPLWRTVPCLLRTRTVDLFRHTWRAFDGRHGGQLGHIALEWVMFPALLPYLLYWDLRFRYMLRKRGQMNTKVVPGRA